MWVGSYLLCTPILILRNPRSLKAILLGSRKICPLPPEHFTAHLTGTTLSEKRNSKRGGLVYTMPGGLRARTPGQYFHSVLGTQSLVGAWQTGSQVLVQYQPFPAPILQSQRERTTVYRLHPCGPGACTAELTNPVALYTLGAAVDPAWVQCPGSSSCLDLWDPESGPWRLCTQVRRRRLWRGLCDLPTGSSFVSPCGLPVSMPPASHRAIASRRFCKGHLAITNARSLCAEPTVSTHNFVTLVLSLSL